MRRRTTVSMVAVLVGAAAMVTVTPAAAHVVPSTTIELNVHECDITAHLTLPAADLTIASGVDVPEAGTLPEPTAEDIARYLGSHLGVSSDAGAWSVSIENVAGTEVEQWGTGAFRAVTATAILKPPSPGDLRSFTLNYDAILHQVVTADVFVLLHSDWATGELESSRSLGTITVDTVTGTFSPLAVRLDEGGAWQGFMGMLTLGMSHIAAGTDHQLFLLTLLLPAPMLALARRWREVAPIGSAVRRITAITIAFTVGHSFTLALGTLGLPAPQQPIEALIAVSILIAAVHAVRPLFPGREPLIAGVFGLVHGMAFSTTLSALDLSGGQLALSLLGFNLGIEIMQLIVVLLVLPPLVVLARTPAYRPLRIAAAAAIAVAALGWLLDRVGMSTPLGAAADAVGTITPWIAGALWVAAAIVLLGKRTFAATSAVEERTPLHPGDSSGDAPPHDGTTVLPERADSH